MTQTIKKLFQAIILLFLLIPAVSNAFTVTYQPAEPRQGDVLFVKIVTENAGSAEAEFQGKKYSFGRVDQKHLIALLPIDIYTSAKEYDLQVVHNGAKSVVNIKVHAREFDTIELTLPEGKVDLSPDSHKRAAKESVMLKKVWESESERTWNTRFERPINTEISTHFGTKRIMNKKRTSVHRGMDFRGKTGTPVQAINNGTVILTDDLFFGGNTVVLDHGMGLYSVYMHLSKFTVTSGDIINKGQEIGLIGNSGRATGPHLHLSVKLHGTSVDPLSLIDLDL
ncbi:MAG: M23 family metallopeptidase [Nitrospira sp.]|nr:M23 family metallopeptidase [bacterium]MBL7048785.1 M23 family metallopeptidase [Nitrospira sp.]